MVCPVAFFVRISREKGLQRGWVRDAYKETDRECIADALVITHSDGFDDRLFLLYNSEVPPWNSRLPVTPLRKIKSETLSILARFPEKVVN